jgi:hypothetical protein
VRAVRASAALATSLIVTAVGAAPAPAAVPVGFDTMRGFDGPATPARYDRVGVLRIGRRAAPNVLVLNPGTSASAAYFAPLAKTLVTRTRGWQVWAVERRENRLEDHSMLDRAKRGRATPRQLFEYYLGHLADPSITDHFELIPDAEVAFAREWGMRVAVEDLRRVVAAARRGGRRVVLGGHSLGGSIATAYATWDFRGRPGARDLAGLVYIDGGSSRDPLTADEAAAALDDLRAGSPWLAFGGIPAPFTGLFNSGASTLVKIDPDGPAIARDFPFVPAELKPPIPYTNAGQYGYALDTATSPPGLVAAQAHLGRLKASGGWERAGELTPLGRYADMFSGWGLEGLDGTAWYHSRRLTIDSGAIAAGNRNPAQRVLDVRATRGRDLPKRLRIYAFAASLGGTRVLDAARVLARQSGISRRRLTLVDRRRAYAHNDPAGAAPRNAFVRTVLPFLAKLG